MSDRFERHLTTLEIVTNSKYEIDQIEDEEERGNEQPGNDLLHIFYVNAWPSLESQIN